MADVAAEYLAMIEDALEGILAASTGGPRSVAAADGTKPVPPSAIRWAMEGGGKRVRPRICLMAAVAAGGCAEDALMPACAIELLHSYTLVHDDLPAMDNDTMRRGKPSVWAKFGEAEAILAGDALQAMAFSTAAKTPKNAARVLSALGRAAEAVVRGQVADLAAVRRVGDNAPYHAARRDAAPYQVESIIADKTAALFVAAAEMGALATDATPDAIEALKTYAYNLGFAFQYQDDLLDADDGAFSSLSIFGADEVRRRVVKHTSLAISSLSGLPGDVSQLSSLAEKLVSRKK